MYTPTILLLLLVPYTPAEPNTYFLEPSRRLWKPVTRLDDMNTDRQEGVSQVDPNSSCRHATHPA